jgi:hypothetical protein
MLAARNWPRVIRPSDERSSIRHFIEEGSDVREPRGCNFAHWSRPRRVVKESLAPLLFAPQPVNRHGATFVWIVAQRPQPTVENE